MNKRTHSEISYPQLSPKSVFGVRSDIPQNIQFFSQDKVAYVAGNYIVIYTIKEKIQNFFPASQEHGEITCFAIDEFMDTIFLIIAQKSCKQFNSTLNFRILNKNFLNSSDNIKTFKLTLTDMDTSEYFSSVSVNVVKGFIIALMGPRTPSVVVLYNYDYRNGNTKLHSIVHMTNQTSYKNIQINIFNPFNVSLYGDGGFAVIQINDVDKKTVNKIEIEPRSSNFQEFSNLIFSFAGSCWVSKSRLVLINSTCDLFVIDFFMKNKLESSYKKAIKNVNIFETPSRGRGIVQRNGNLFICRDDGKIVKLEDKQQSEKIIVYEKSNKGSHHVINLPKMEVQCIDINNANNSNSISFSAIVLSSTSSQVYFIDITNENSLSDGNNYKFLISPFHSDGITSIDIARQKSLLVSCSRDRYLRIWNYYTSTLELSELYDDEPIYVAFHPAGLHLGVLFHDKFCMMEIIENKLVTHQEIAIFEPTEIKFSNFGHMFSICYKNCFHIYNFYTCELIYKSKLQKEGIGSHTNNLTCLTWNDDDSGFATCGSDGRAIYWQLYIPEQPHLIAYHKKDFRFSCIQVLNIIEDVKITKNLLIMDQSSIIEIDQKQYEIKENDSSVNLLSNSNEIYDTDDEDGINKVKEKFKIVLQGLPFVQFIVDSETKLFISGTKNVPSLHISFYPFISQKNSYKSYQAHSHGLNMFKISHDMTHLFTGGDDKCLFIFTISNIYKSSTKFNESLETNNLVLVAKEKLDLEENNLISKLGKINKEIDLEIENSDKILIQLEKEFENLKAKVSIENETFLRDKLILKEQENNIKNDYENLLNNNLKSYEQKVLILKTEHFENKFAVDKDIEKEKELMKNEKSKYIAILRQLKLSNEEELVNLKNSNHESLTNLKNEINEIEKRCYESEKIIEKERNDSIETNDDLISIKRGELEQLKKNFEKIKINHSKLDEKLKSEIYEIKASIKLSDTKRIEDRNNLCKYQTENSKIIKSLTDLQFDKKEKESMIIQKNELKKSLEMQNQELEKFKFVLNFKIKELKHEKDPKENKLSSLEKQANDMEKEIKSFEKAQANYILDLSYHHEVIKIRHLQILEIQKNLEKTRNYIKLFTNSLYLSITKTHNSKDIKKELILLKELYLDKEFIDIESNNNPSNVTQSQRNLLEANIENNKMRLDFSLSHLSKDFTKMMRENKQLLVIANELQLEKKEIELSSFEMINVSKSSNIPKMNHKPKEKLPIIKRGFNIEKHAKNLLRELFEIEKEIQFIRELKYKEELRIKKKSKLEIVIEEN